MTQQEFNDLIAPDRLVLVDFFATWCGPCRAMHPVIDTLESQMRSVVDVVRLNVDLFENSEPVQHYRVMSVPTLILFRQGRMLWRESGVVSLDTLTDVVRRFDRVEAY
ncbi:MAG: conjugal transfer protein TraF [Alistipes sp.]|nr:conjugal transfer protein TraF [Alistipes sp.]MBQ6581871.1 conjugal transfer protein TraF [Alistipes sp.]